MTASEPARHVDSEPDTTFYPVVMVEDICKAVIRAAHAPGLRQAMWEAVQARLKGAAEDSPDWMPWDLPETVTRITGEAASRCLIAMLEAVPDIAERNRLAKIGQREAEKAEQAEDTAGIPAGKLPVRCCAQCGGRFRPKRDSARFCGQSCRQQAFRLRRKPPGSS